MILFVGAPGSGKSVQGQVLSARNEWRWLSAGQLLRDTHDPELYEQMKSGQMVSNELVNRVIREAVQRAKDVSHVIMDGYPRMLEQAEWLVEELPKHERAISAVIVLDVPEEEIVRRLRIRGRLDDAPEIVAKRMADYQREIEPLLAFYKQKGIPVFFVDGVGTVGTVHDRIQEVIDQCLPA